MMIMERNDLTSLIKDMRIKAGLTEHELAKACGKSINEYLDIEAYDDEIYMVVELGVIDCICCKIRIGFDELFGITPSDELLPKNIISRTMKEKNISISTLSDCVGVEEYVINDIQENILNIEDRVMDELFLLSKCLGLSLSSLFNSFAKYRHEKENRVE